MNKRWRVYKGSDVEIKLGKYGKVCDVRAWDEKVMGKW